MAQPEEAPKRSSLTVKTTLYVDELKAFTDATIKHSEVAHTDISEGTALRTAIHLYCKHFGVYCPTRTSRRASQNAKAKQARKRRS